MLLSSQVTNEYRLAERGNLPETLINRPSEYCSFMVVWMEKSAPSREGFTISLKIGKEGGSSYEK